MRVVLLLFVHFAPSQHDRQIAEKLAADLRLIINFDSIRENSQRTREKHPDIYKPLKQKIV